MGRKEKNNLWAKRHNFFPFLIFCETAFVWSSDPGANPIWRSVFDGQDHLKVMNEFLKDLPTRNRENFSRLHCDASVSGSPGGSLYASRNTVTTRGRGSCNYVPTKDIPADAVIVTEKTNILLRYLHQQWDKKDKTAARKRELEAAAAAAGASGANGNAKNSDEESARKKPRLDPLPINPNSQEGNNSQQSSSQPGPSGSSNWP